MPQKTDLLSGIRILDLTHVLAGPYCTMILGDLGAEVIKVESTKGDQVRQIPPLIEGESHYFLAVNRNKKSFSCDLKDRRVSEIVRRLALSSDVVVDNFRPGVTSRLGFDHESLVRDKPDIITCSITGFGPSGPWATRPSFDLVNQAMSGIMSVTGDPAGPPVKCGIPIGDLAGGLWAAIAILGALQRRSSTRQGCRLEISLLDGLLSLLGYLSQLALLEEKNVERMGNGHHSIVPYGRFETSDGELVVALHVGNFWRAFVDATDRDARLTDPRFRTTTSRQEHRDELEPIVEDILRSRTTAEWEERLLAAGVPHGPILGVYDALMSEHVQETGLLETMAHPQGGTVTVVASPICVDGHRAVGGGDEILPPPRLGEHADELLRELNIPDAEIARLVADGVLIPDQTVAGSVS